MERIIINTQNLKIEDDQIQNFKALLGDALKTGPSDATLCCCILRENETFVMNMRIHSATGHFPIHCEADKVYQLIGKTTIQMKELFKQWHDSPKEFAKNHKMGSQACKNLDGSTLRCPLKSIANEKFE